MRRSILVMNLVVQLALPCVVVAQNGYTIRIKELGVGAICRVEKDESLVERIQHQDPVGRNLQNRASVMGEISVYHETILAKVANKPPSRLKRTYERAMKREGDQLQALAYHGRTVLIERKNDRYHFWLTGRGELTAAEAIFLDREFNGADERFGLKNLLPAGAVRPGNYAWNVDMAPLLKDLARTGKLQADPLRCRGAGHLKRVWRDEKEHLLGEFVFQLELGMSAIKLGREKIPLRPGAKGFSEMTLEMCIDGSIFHLVHKDTMKIDATGPFRTMEGLLGQVAITVESNNKGDSREVVQK